jgi:diadenosine tetraphosphate (Ap4A) HIT family hydrolase
MNETLAKFGYPDSCVFENGAWAVLLRPKQATLMSLVLCNKGNSKHYGDLSKKEYELQKNCVEKIEKLLFGKIGAKKMNYLMLMMKDPHVHFHVIPRFDEPKNFHGGEFSDPAWPSAPDLSHQNDVDDAMRGHLIGYLRREMK